MRWHDVHIAAKYRRLDPISHEVVVWFSCCSQHCACWRLSELRPWPETTLMYAWMLIIQHYILMKYRIFLGPRWNLCCLRWIASDYTIPVWPHYILFPTESQHHSWTDVMRIACTSNATMSESKSMFCDQHFERFGCRTVRRFGVSHMCMMMLRSALGTHGRITHCKTILHSYNYKIGPLGTTRHIHRQIYTLAAIYRRASWSCRDFVPHRHTRKTHSRHNDRYIITHITPKKDKTHTNTHKSCFVIYTKTNPDIG